MTDHDNHDDYDNHDNHDDHNDLDNHDNHDNHDGDEGRDGYHNEDGKDGEDQHKDFPGPPFNIVRNSSKPEKVEGCQLNFSPVCTVHSALSCTVQCALVNCAPEHSQVVGRLSTEEATFLQCALCTAHCAVCNVHLYIVRFPNPRATDSWGTCTVLSLIAGW